MRPVPEVTASGRPEPASASPSASTACTFASMASAMLVVVSEMLLKAVWMTPSAAAAPARRLARSSMEPWCTVAPAAATAAAADSDLARPVTWCPASMSSRTTADPMNPLAPVTNTRMIDSLAQMMWTGLACCARRREAEAPGVLLCPSLGTAWVSGNPLIQVIRIWVIRPLSRTDPW
jgi:hypothetical protein